MKKMVMVTKYDVKECQRIVLIEWNETLTHFCLIICTLFTVEIWWMKDKKSFTRIRFAHRISKWWLSYRFFHFWLFYVFSFFYLFFFFSFSSSCFHPWLNILQPYAVWKTFCSPYSLKESLFHQNIVAFVYFVRLQIYFSRCQIEQFQ